MSRGRRQKRGRSPQRLIRRKPSVPHEPSLRLVVVTAPQATRNGASLANEIGLIRAAILYADEVELVSPGAEMLAAAAAFAEGSATDLVSLIAALDDETIHALGGENWPPNWRSILPGVIGLGESDWDLLSEVTGSEIPSEVRTISSQLDDAMAAMRTSVEHLLQEAGAPELLPAMNAGLVRISPTLTAVEGKDVEDPMGPYLDRLRALLRDPRSRLLLDDTMASLARALVAEGHAPTGALTLANASQAAVGSGLLARVPAFPHLPMDELLDLRHELEGPLARYRRSVAGLAQLLRVGPFDADLDADVDAIYVSHIAPALEDLREGFAQHSLVRECARQLGTDLRSLVAASVGPALSLGAASLTDLSGWIALAAGAAPPVLATGQTVARAGIERGEHQARLRGHDLYYIYEIARRSERAANPG